jgi:hypothetical protein
MCDMTSNEIGSRFPKRRPARRGLSRVDVIVLIVSAVALLAILTMMLFRLGPESSITVGLRDMANLRQVHQGINLFAMESNGLYPRPGLMRRMPIEVDGEWRFVPGRGDENPSYNTTDRVYSSMIAARYISPDLLISPGEVNPNVQPMRDFNYEAYSPAGHSYWDDRFEANLERTSHTSYAHLLLFGDRKYLLWNDRAPGDTPLLGTRGPKDGVADPDSYTTDPRGNWRGAIVRNDNTTVILESMVLEPPPGDPADTPQPDNLFDMEGGPHGEDVILTFTLAIGDDGPTIQHD